MQLNEIQYEILYTASEGPVEDGMSAEDDEAIDQLTEAGLLKSLNITEKGRALLAELDG